MTHEFRAAENAGNHRHCWCGSPHKSIRPAAGGSMLVCSNRLCAFYGEDAAPAQRDTPAPR